MSDIDAAAKKLADEKDHITENPNTASLIAEYLTEQCKKDEPFAVKVNLEGYHKSAEGKHPKRDRIEKRITGCLQCGSMTRDLRKKR